MHSLLYILSAETPQKLLKLLPEESMRSSRSSPCPIYGVCVTQWYFSNSFLVLPMGIQ